MLFLHKTDKMKVLDRVNYR